MDESEDKDKLFTPEEAGDQRRADPGGPVRGAEGGPDSPAAGKLPSDPASDDSALGDTDQHSAS
jgi:hypothetical protein